MPWSSTKNCEDPWNLVGWVIPRLSWSRWMDLPNLTLTKYASGGSIAPGNTFHFPHATFPIIPLGQRKCFTFHRTHFLDSCTHWRQFITSQSVALSAIAVCQTFFQVLPLHKNNISIKPIVFFSSHFEFHRITDCFNGYFNLELILA